MTLILISNALGGSIAATTMLIYLWTINNFNRGMLNIIIAIQTIAIFQGIAAIILHQAKVIQ